MNNDSDVKRLYRSPRDRMIAGVCGGFAEYLGVDPALVRILWLLTVFAGGLGLWLYIAAWIVVPERPATAEELAQPRPSNTGVIWGVVLVVVGLFLLGRRFEMFDFWPYFSYWHWNAWPWWRLDADVWIPLLIIIAGVVYIFYTLSRGSQAGKAAQTPAQAEPAAEAAPRVHTRLYRVRQGRMILGVCTGLADHFKMDVSLIRLFWVLGTLLTSVTVGVLLYFILAIVLPEKPPETSTSTTEQGEVPTGSESLSSE